MSRDWSGYKYTIFKSLGFNVDMIFGYQPDDQQQMTFHLLSHEYHDGVGAFRKLCQYYDIQLPESAVRHTRPNPPLSVKLKRLWQHLHNAPKIDYDWKAYDTRMEGESTGFSYALLSESSSHIISNYCKENNIGETALLLYALDQAATLRCLNRFGRRSWLLPHDFRRALGKQFNNSNITAPLNLLLEGSHTPGSIYKELKTLYRNDMLWGGWVYTNFSAYLPGWLISLLLKRMHKPGWFGVFANMGRWQSETEPTQKGHWVSAPPAAIVSPITAGAFTWNGQMALSLQCHPSVKLDQQGIESLLEQWLEVLSQTVKKPLDVKVSSLGMTTLIKEAIRL